VHGYGCSLFIGARCQMRGCCCLRRRLLHCRRTARFVSSFHACSSWLAWVILHSVHTCHRRASGLYSRANNAAPTMRGKTSAPPNGRAKWFRFPVIVSAFEAREMLLDEMAGWDSEFRSGVQGLVTLLCNDVTVARAETMAPCCQESAWLRWLPAK
jgi:hypothetical protein